MALPNILRRLFKGGGYGPELNDGIVSKAISNQDWSNSYDYPVGVVVRGSDGGLYYSVAQSGPNTGTGAVDPTTDTAHAYWREPFILPVGTVLWSANPAAPLGYLLCNGAAISRTTYADLFAVIGTTYGTGDGSTTFNLPNLIDKFIEGASSGIGSNIAAGLPNIWGYLASRPTASDTGAITYGTGAFTYSAKADEGTSAPLSYSGSQTKKDGVTFLASNSNSIYGNSNTVQPPAIKLLPCIKY